MGTKGGKPVSAIEKRQMRIAKKEERKAVKEEKREYKLTVVDPSLLKKVSEDIKNLDFVTTSTIAQRFNIKYSMAKKILKILVTQNLIDVILKTRRVIVATPVRSNDTRTLTSTSK